MELWNKEQITYMDSLYLFITIAILVKNEQIIFVVNVKNMQKRKTRKKNVMFVVIGIIAVEIVGYHI